MSQRTERAASRSAMKSLGLRVKSGFAIAVALERRESGICVVSRWRVALSSDEFPQSRFPYHPTVELPAREGNQLSERAVAVVRRVAARELDLLLSELGQLERAGLVVGSVANPDVIANPHIRAHALEGKLFRDVIADALSERGVKHAVLLERDAYDKAARDLERSAATLRMEIDTLGKGCVKPWRSEEKLATLAAYWQLQLA